MSNVGKRGKLRLETRLRAALLNGTNTRLEHHEIERVIQALLKPHAREEAQPVAWVVRQGLSTGSLFYTERGQNADLPDGTLLYTTPPAPEAEKLRVALDDLRAWHTERHKALSKQPPSPDRDWRKAEHAEEIARIEAVLEQEGQA